MKPSFTHNTVLQKTKSEELVKEPSTLNHQPSSLNIKKNQPWQLFHCDFLFIFKNREMGGSLILKISKKPATEVITKST
jgi:hypothetical protein